MQRAELDDLDRKIIAFLTEDGSLSTTEIAARISGSTERTVRNRITALLQNRMIVIGAIPDPMAMGHDVQADVMIEVQPGMVEQVAVDLGEHDEISYLAATTGRFALSASLAMATHGELLDFCENTIGRIPGVLRMEPRVILRIYKACGTRTTALNQATDRAGKKPA